MRIAIADNNSRKFTDDLIKHWEASGHDVRYESGASEYLAQWADVYYIDTWDNNIHYLWKLYHGIEGVSRTNPWDNNRKPKIVVRALDWEVWLGFARDQSIIDWVDKVICIAPHIERELRSKANFDNKLKCIYPGVNLNKFTLKETRTDGFQLGMVLGDMWKYKNHMGGLDIFTTLYHHDDRWRLHIRGQHESGIYDPENWQYYLESRGIAGAVSLYASVSNMNEWYERLDILLHPGQKEAFCYAIGEALAKGIPVIANDFLGSRDIWYPDMLYQTHEEAVKKIKELHVETETMKYLSSRMSITYIKEKYDLQRMCQEIDEFIGI